VVTTPLVAFVDSDCKPPENWLALLLGYFEDPMVAAVAPRIVPATVPSPTPLTRYEAVRSSLDRGEVDGLVRPLSRIPYVPSATLIVRREVTSQPFFDPGLRGGEDVDLVWRLAEAGWDVRYVASCTVTHQGPHTLHPWLRRRTFYGTTAGPLARRHPASLAPVTTSVWTAGVWGLLVTRRPRWAATVLAASILLLARRLSGLVDQPMKVATQIAGGGTTKSVLPALGGLSRAWSPALLVGLLFGRTRRMAAAALLAPAIGNWMAKPGELDPMRFAALHVTDDLAYGAGVWKGCVNAHTLRPLVPRIALRSRVWSTGSLRTQLGNERDPSA
jgi:mycofactocin system glycosyltransferase